MSKGLDPDQDRCPVGPGLDPNCLQKITADDESRWLSMFSSYFCRLLITLSNSLGPDQAQKNHGWARVWYCLYSWKIFLNKFILKWLESRSRGWYSILSSLSETSKFSSELGCVLHIFLIPKKTPKTGNILYIWASAWDFGTYRIFEQRRLSGEPAQMWRLAFTGRRHKVQM